MNWKIWLESGLDSSWLDYAINPTLAWTICCWGATLSAPFCVKSKSLTMFLVGVKILSRIISGKKRRQLLNKSSSVSHSSLLWNMANDLHKKPEMAVELVLHDSHFPQCFNVPPSLLFVVEPNIMRATKVTSILLLHIWNVSPEQRKRHSKWTKVD